MKKTLVKEFRPYEKPSTIGENTDIEDMIRHFTDYPRIHHLCVVDKDMKLLGLINRKRMFKIIFSHYATSVPKFSSLFTLHTAKTSGEIMVTHIISTTEDATTDSVIHLLAEHNIHELPVLDADNRVLGFISSLRIMEQWLREKENDIM